MKGKLVSRKFLICVAVFLYSIVMSVVGIAGSNEVIVWIALACAMICTAVYTICEAAVDRARIFSNVTETTINTSSTMHQTVEARSDDNLTVAAIMVPNVLDESTNAVSDEKQS